MQIVRKAQTRSEVGVDGRSWNCAGEHVERGAQTRLEDQVGGTLCHCVEVLQEVKDAHERSDSAEGATV